MKCTVRTASAKRICSPEYQHKSTNDRKPVEQVRRKTLQRTIFIFHFTTSEQMQASCRMSPSSLTFLAEVVWPNLPILSLRDHGDRDGLHRALPARRPSHQRGEWGRHRRGRPRGHRADGERNGCTQEGVWRVHYEVFIIMKLGEFFITINLSSGRRIKCIDSHRSGEWVILRHVSCPEVSSI